MDANVVLIIALFALIIVAAFLVFRRRANVNIHGPAGIGLELDVSNEETLRPPAAVINKAQAKGKIVAEDLTGIGSSITDAKAGEDIIARTVPPEQNKRSKR